jgi:hypothetical protein
MKVIICLIPLLVKDIDLVVIEMWVCDLVGSFFCTDCYCDLPVGVFLVRGDNIVIFGEIDEDKEKNLPLKQVTQPELQERIAAGEKKAVDWDLE